MTYLADWVKEGFEVSPLLPPAHIPKFYDQPLTGRPTMPKDPNAAPPVVELETTDVALRALMLKILADQDYYGHPTDGRVPPAATREAIVTAVIGGLIEAQNSARENARRDKITDVVDGMMLDLLYYDRKEDEELPVGAIEEAIVNAVITIDDIVNQVRVALMRALS